MPGSSVLQNNKYNILYNSSEKEEIWKLTSCGFLSVAIKVIHFFFSTCSTKKAVIIYLVQATAL